MDVDISKWHPIGWKQDFFGRPLQESVSGEIVTIDELMARYNFLLVAAQHGVQPTAIDAENSTRPHEVTDDGIILNPWRGG